MQNAFSDLSRRFQVGPHAALSVLIIRRMLQITVNFSNFCSFFGSVRKERLLASACLSVCLSVTVRPHGITGLPLDGYS
jgi:hypothetical protein